MPTAVTDIFAPAATTTTIAPSMPAVVARPSAVIEVQVTEAVAVSTEALTVAVGGAIS